MTATAWRIAGIGCGLAFCALAQAASAEGEPSIFAGGITNAIITLVIFVIVLTILSKKAWGPLLNLLNERERSIREALETAQRERTEAERLLHQYKQQLDAARAEASAIVEEGRRDAEVVRTRVHQEAREEAERMLARARSEIQLATDAAVKQLYDEAAGLAVNVAGGILQKQLSVSQDDQRALVQRALEEMRSGGQARLN
jgi:F-type H+-transporting ATPase subunit b